MIILASVLRVSMMQNMSKNAELVSIHAKHAKLQTHVDYVIFYILKEDYLKTFVSVQIDIMTTKNLIHNVLDVIIVVLHVKSKI